MHLSYVADPPRGFASCYLEKVMKRQWVHLTMCFRAAAGALVSQAPGGRALLQAKGLWLE